MPHKHSSCVIFFRFQDGSVLRYDVQTDMQIGKLLSMVAEWKGIPLELYSFVSEDCQLIDPARKVSFYTETEAEYRIDVFIDQKGC